MISSNRLKAWRFLRAQKQNVFERLEEENEDVAFTRKDSFARAHIDIVQ